MAREPPSNNVDVDDTLAIRWGPASYETSWWTLTDLLLYVGVSVVLTLQLLIPIAYLPSKGVSTCAYSPIGITCS